MKVGFIGAGRMGFSLGKHLLMRSTLEVIGYYSKSADSAKEAARFTDTKYYEDLKELVADADALFLTVPDGQIEAVVRELDTLDVSLEGKVLCHTSGALSSQVFSGIKDPVYGYSIHPIYAVNSKLTSYEKFGECFITLEGHPKYINFWKQTFEAIGHSTKVIDAKDKVKYHGSAVFASNLVVGLYQMALELLEQCGFNDEEANKALSTLFTNNANNIVSVGTTKALTGPVSRFDKKTVAEHMQVLDGDYLTTYQALSRTLVSIAHEQAKLQNDYNEIEVNAAHKQLMDLLSDK